MNTYNQRRNGMIIGFLLFAALLLTACAPAGGTEPAASEETGAATAVPSDEPGPEEVLNDFAGKVWLLQQMGDFIPAADAQPTLEINGDGVQGSTGCNNYFGPITLDNKNISIAPLGMTEMWCEGRMEQERAYVEMLQAVHSYTTSENQLILHTDAGDMSFILATDSPLEGTQWVLSGISTGDGIVHTWMDEEINIRFADGTAAGNSGCNNFSGKYTLAENGLEIGQLISTLMACEEDERNEREAEFLAALAKVAAFEIKRDTLTMFDEQGDLLITFSVEEEAALPSTEITLIVGPERVPCEGVGPQECYQIKREADGEWELLYDEIQGFEWEPGFEYELRVQVTTNENVPADASAQQYQLLNVVTQTAIN